MEDQRKLYFSTQTYGINSYDSQQKTFWRTRTMTSYQQRNNGDGPADLTTKAPHFFKIVMPQILQEGKLVRTLS